MVPALRRGATHGLFVSVPLFLYVLLHTSIVPVRQRNRYVDQDVIRLRAVAAFSGSIDMGFIFIPAS